jgi:hypothetical protein
VHNNCCESNTDQNRKFVVEHHIGTDHDAELQLEGKINHDRFNPIRNRLLRFYFLPCAELVKIAVVLAVEQCYESCGLSGVKIFIVAL